MIFSFCSNRIQRKHGEAKGGPYLAVHMRRRDFLYGHKDEVPSIEGTAEQIEKMLKLHKIRKLFVATDAPTAGNHCNIILFISLVVTTHITFAK